jgi:tetratricopeptide (TPR) repeat protein
MSLSSTVFGEDTGGWINLEKTSLSKKKHNQFKKNFKPISDSDLAKLNFIEARRLYESGRIDDAQALLEKTLDIKTNVHEPRVFLSEIYFKSGNVDLALETIEDGIKIYGRQNILSLWSAFYYNKLNNFDKSLELLKNVPREMQSNITYHALLASNYLAKEKYDLAKKYYSTLVSHQPNVSQWWLGLGIASRNSGEYAISQHAFKNVLQIGGVDENTLNFVSQQLISKNGIKEDGSK